MGKRYFELLDVDTGNMLGTYTSEDAALRDVAETIRRHGRESRAVQDLALGDERHQIAAGDALAARALERFPFSSAAQLAAEG